MKPPRETAPGPIICVRQAEAFPWNVSCGTFQGQIINFIKSQICKGNRDQDLGVPSLRNLAEQNSQPWNLRDRFFEQWFLRWSPWALSFPKCTSDSRTSWASWNWRQNFPSSWLLQWDHSSSLTWECIGNTNSQALLKTYWVTHSGIGAGHLF